MEGMSHLLGKSPEEYLKNRQASQKQKPASHQLAATVNLIKEAGLFTPKYGYKYWLGKTKRAGVDFNEMIGILKEVRGMDAKYNKGGRLTNVLTARANQIKNNAKKEKSS